MLTVPFCKTHCEESSNAWKGQARAARFSVMLGRGEEGES